MSLLCFFLYEDIQIFNHLSRPWRLTQKFQAGLDRWIVFETTDIDTITQLMPAIMVDQASHDSLKGFAVQRIIDLLVFHPFIIVTSAALVKS